MVHSKPHLLRTAVTSEHDAFELIQELKRIHLQKLRFIIARIDIFASKALYIDKSMSLSSLEA